MTQSRSPKPLAILNEVTTKPYENVIIIGSGPAGYTAALYAARGKLNPLLFEGSVTAGGALMNTTHGCAVHRPRQP